MEHDALLKPYLGEVPGICIRIIRNGKAVHTKSHGYALLEEHQKITSRTNFRLASVTKQFTAYAILQLIASDKISFDTTLTEIFAEFPEYARTITVYHLLTHTSGLADYEDLLEGTQAPVSDQDVLTILSEQPKHRFPAGTQFSYNNGGYCLLACMIEKVTGKSFARYLKEHIFDPLGMKGSVVNERDETLIAHRAYGYVREDKTHIQQDQDLTSQTQGDGGVYSSVQDLTKWNRELDDPRLLPRKYVRAAMSVQYLTNGEQITSEDGGYGFGFFIDQVDGHRVVRHGGESVGFRTAIYKVPDKDLAVLVLSNNTAHYGSDIARQIAKRF